MTSEMESKTWSKKYKIKIWRVGRSTSIGRKKKNVNKNPLFPRAIGKF